MNKDIMIHRLPLTPAQISVLETIRDYYLARGVFPSLRAITRLRGLKAKSTNGTSYTLRRLQAKGLVEIRTSSKSSYSVYWMPGLLAAIRPQVAKYFRDITERVEATTQHGTPLIHVNKKSPDSGLASCGESPIVPVSNAGDARETPEG